MKKGFESKAGKEMGLDYNAVLNARNNLEFDNLFFSRVQGYKTMDDWYNNESFAERLSEYPIPTLFMFAEDDPVVPIEDVPREKFVANPNIIYTEFKTGGHIAMFTGWRPRKGYPKPIIEFINAVHSI